MQRVPGKTMFAPSVVGYPFFRCWFRVVKMNGSLARRFAACCAHSMVDEPPDKGLTKS